MRVPTGTSVLQGKICKSSSHLRISGIDWFPLPPAATYFRPSQSPVGSNVKQSKVLMYLSDSDRDNCKQFVARLLTAGWFGHHQTESHVTLFSACRSFLEMVLRIYSSLSFDLIEHDTIPSSCCFHAPHFGFFSRSSSSLVRATAPVPCVSRM